LGTLSSEFTPHIGALSGEPRIYADANIPNGIVGFMRARLRWDVLFVLEHDDLRRARDIEHYRLARQLGRTLVTLDRDYIDDRTFPPAEGAGVIVFWAPDEPRLRVQLERADQALFRAEGARPLPLEGRKLRWPLDGNLDGEPDARTRT
jgi:uncharacterized protein DUF5615